MSIFPTNGEFFNPDKFSLREASPRTKRLARAAGGIGLAAVGALTGMVGINQMTNHGNLLIGAPELGLGLAAFVGGVGIAFPQPHEGEEIPH